MNIQTIGDLKDLINVLKENGVSHYHKDGLTLTFDENQRYAPFTLAEPETPTYKGKEEREREINQELFGRP